MNSNSRHYQLAQHPTMAATRTPFGVVCRGTPLSVECRWSRTVDHQVNLQPKFEGRPVVYVYVFCSNGTNSYRHHSRIDSRLLKAQTTLLIIQFSQHRYFVVCCATHNRRSECGMDSTIHTLFTDAENIFLAHTLP